MLADSTPLPQISEYIAKWRSLYLECNSLDEEKVKNAIDRIYTDMGLASPKIEYWCNPLLVSSSFDLDYWGNQLIIIDEQIELNLIQQLGRKRWQELHFQIYEPFHQQLWVEVGTVIYDLLRDDYTLWHELNKPLEDNNPYFNPVMDFTTTAYLIARGCLFNYAYEVLNCQRAEHIWQSYRYLAINCGWLLTYKDICVICSRPVELRVDAAMRLHGIGKPAILFADSVSIYAYKGEILPAQYGNVHPSGWQIKWIFQESCPEIRRILVEGIGYDRICKAKSCTKLDSFGDSILLEIDLYDDDNKPARLLKIEYVDTGNTDILRVPPNINSVKEAIRWVNWERNFDCIEFYSVNSLRSYS